MLFFRLVSSEERISDQVDLPLVRLGPDYGFTLVDLVKLLASNANTSNRVNGFFFARSKTIRFPKLTRAEENPATPNDREDEGAVEN